MSSYFHGMNVFYDSIGPNDVVCQLNKAGRVIFEMSKIRLNFKVQNRLLHCSDIYYYGQFGVD